MSRLFLRFTSSVQEACPQVDWLVRAEDGSVAAQGSTAIDQLDDLAAAAPWRDDPSRVVVFLPVAETLALSCTIPGRNATQIRQAAPYAVEEFIAEDIEAMHVACAAIVRNEPVRCLVSPRTTLQAVLDHLAAAGVRAGYMTADAMALPAQPNTATVLNEGQSTVLLRTFEQAACVDEPNLGSTLAAIRGNFGDDGEKSGGDGGDGGKELELLIVNAAEPRQEWSRLALVATTVEQVSISGSPLDYLASALDEREAINLLQGEFAVKRRTDAAWGRWRTVAAAAGAWLAIALVLLIAEGFWADMQADTLRADAEQLYKDIYKVSRVPGNPAARMRFRLGQTPTQTVGFHSLLANLGLSLQDIAGSYELERLIYNERNGLSAELIVPGYEALEALQQALAQRGFELDVVSAEQQDDRVRANLRVAGRT